MTAQSKTSEAVTLFQKIEADFRKTQVLSEKWYIVVIAALAGGINPLLCQDLYLYLISKPEFSTSSQRQELIRRLREALVKSVSIVGVCKPLEAIMAINEVENEDDKDRSITRQSWQCNQDNLDRGMDWMRKIYTRNTDNTLGLFQDHRDFEWISRNITYGLYLSDRQILDDVDTEILVVAGIMIQNLPKETHWHLRGIRRLGISREDVEIVWDSVNLIASFLELKLDRIPTVKDVEKDI